MALNHVDARITFNIIPAVGVTFEPEAYRVINIPVVLICFRARNKIVEIIHGIMMEQAMLRVIG